MNQNLGGFGPLWHLMIGIILVLVDFGTSSIGVVALSYSIL